MGIFPDPQPSSFYGKAQIWDVESCRLLREFIVPTPVISIAWSQEVSTIALGHMDGKITLWDCESGMALKSLLATSERSDVNGLAWSPNGKMLAAAQQDGKMRIWNPESGEILMTSAGNNGWLRGISWSPEGNMLASSGEDAQIRVWRITDGQMVACLKTGSMPNWSLKWSAEGNWLATGNGLFDGEPHASSVYIFKTNDGW
jgi:WD40 repeat protein